MRPRRHRYGWRGALFGMVLTAMSLPFGEAGRASAQSLPQAIVAVIDYQRLMRESSAAVAIREQVEVRRNALQGDIGKEEQRLMEAEKELAKKRTLLAAEAFQAERAKFEQEVADAQRSIQERRKSLDEVSAAALNQVRSAIIELADDMASDRGFNLVLPSSSVLLFNSELDLTDELLTRLNSKLPSVTVGR